MVFWAIIEDYRQSLIVALKSQERTNKMKRTTIFSLIGTFIFMFCSINSALALSAMVQNKTGKTLYVYDYQTQPNAAATPVVVPSGTSKSIPMLMGKPAMRMYFAPERIDCLEGKGPGSPCEASASGSKAVGGNIPFGLLEYNTAGNLNWDLSYIDNCDGPMTLQINNKGEVYGLTPADYTSAVNKLAASKPPWNQLVWTCPTTNFKRILPPNASIPLVNPFSKFFPADKPCPFAPKYTNMQVWQCTGPLILNWQEAVKIHEAHDVYLQCFGKRRPGVYFYPKNDQTADKGMKETDTLHITIYPFNYKGLVKNPLASSQGDSPARDGNAVPVKDKGADEYL